MSNLLGLQNRFQSYLLENSSDIQQAIVATDKVPVNTRLGIYLDAYQLRLVEALASNYPVMQQYLGTDEFHQLSNSYLKNHPSTYRSIRWFGDNFSDFLEHYDNEHAFFLAELAEFEWKMTLAFDAADDEILQIEQMAIVPAESWATMRFIPHASLNYMRFSWNVVELWQAISNEQAIVEPVKYSNPLSWVLWRYDYMNRFYALSSEEEAWALEALVKGLSFSELCAGLCNWVDEQEVGLRAASFLKGWIQSGLLSKIEF